MLSYRTFRNIDPPSLMAIWQSRAGQSGLAQPISVELLEQRVFGKIYFDYAGLFLAFDGDRPVGFAHAGFGPNQKHGHLSTEAGVVCMVMVRPDCPEDQVAAGLLERCEAYLLQRGSKVLYGGAPCFVSPFYLGLYGGSQPPGVLESDLVAMNLYRSSGYQEIGHTLIFRRSLADFRAPVSRQQMQCRRIATFQMTVDPPSQDWWEACTIGDLDLIRFELISKTGKESMASATVRDMRLGATGARRMAGLMDIHVNPANRRQGMGTCLLGEVFRWLAEQGFTEIEAQAREDNTAWVGLARKLGVQLVETATIFRKEVRG
jgi:GNAT superfamily N-acetyltransferase